jgi:hypothetical protein
VIFSFWQSDRSEKLAMVKQASAIQVAGRIRSARVRRQMAAEENRIENGAD